MAVLSVAIPNLIVEEAPPERVSEATGTLSVIRSVFLGIGSQLFAFALTVAIISDPQRCGAQWSGSAAPLIARPKVR